MYAFDLSSSSSTAKFLNDESSDEDMLEKAVGAVPTARRASLWSQVMRHLLVHSGLLVIYTAILFSFWPKSINQDSSEVYSPALPAVHWEFQTFENSLETTNPYKGPPRPELDDAWDKLLAPSAIRMSKEDLHRMNRTSVELLDGSGYFGTLGQYTKLYLLGYADGFEDVHHQLHCLRWVRESIHPEYYPLPKEKNRKQHVDHCLDALRQFVMCKADVTVLTYDWMPQFHRPWPNFEVQHKCANWNHIQEWAVTNSFDGYDEKLVRHPNFHPELASPFSYDVDGNDDSNLSKIS